MKILVTGANGHLGANLVRALLKRQYEVVAFVRENADRQGLDGLDISIAVGDILDLASFKQAAEGCDVIIHTAAVYKWWLKDMDVIISTAVEGTKNLFEAAKHAQVKRIVYTSSAITIGTTSDPSQTLTAEHWNSTPHSPYVEAKVKSEREAWRLSEETEIPMIVINPGALFGPYDYRITPSTGILLGLADGSGQTFESGLAFTDVRDVAEIHALAVEQGQIGQRYAAVGHNVHFLDLGKAVTMLTGKKVGHFNPPAPIARFLAGILEFGSRFTGKEPMVTQKMLDDFNGRYNFIDASATYEEFEYQPMPFDQTLQEALDWLIKIDALAPIQSEFHTTPSKEAVSNSVKI